ncbi:MAG: hypothetical protein IPJ16_16470 [Bacteroidales bacterium]|nr:hypothetical protein [Bacteroidales bacterium]
MFENIDSVKNNGKKDLADIFERSNIELFLSAFAKESKRSIIAHKVVTIPGVDNKGIEENIKYLYQDINIYNENILLVSNQFLSPIASSATTFTVIIL